MTIPQKKLREIVFQLLYSRDMGYAEESDLIELIMKELAVTKNVTRQALQKVFAVEDKKEEIDRHIANISESYAFERIQSVERNILRLGIFELLVDELIPPKVAIAEAMRLARKFGTPESASFVNAMLDNLHKSSQGEKSDSKIIQETLMEMAEKENLSIEGAEVREQEKDQHDQTP